MRAGAIKNWPGVTNWSVFSKSSLGVGRHSSGTLGLSHHSQN